MSDGTPHAAAVSPRGSGGEGSYAGGGSSAGAIRSAWTLGLAPASLDAAYWARTSKLWARTVDMFYIVITLYELAFALFAYGPLVGRFAPMLIWLFATHLVLLIHLPALYARFRTPLVSVMRFLRYMVLATIVSATELRADETAVSPFEARFSWYMFAKAGVSRTGTHVLITQMVGLPLPLVVQAPLQAAGVLALTATGASCNAVQLLRMKGLPDTWGTAFARRIGRAARAPLQAAATAGLLRSSAAAAAGERDVPPLAFALLFGQCYAGLVLPLYVAYRSELRNKQRFLEHERERQRASLASAGAAAPSPGASGDAPYPSSAMHVQLGWPLALALLGHAVCLAALALATALALHLALAALPGVDAWCPAGAVAHERG